MKKILSIGLIVLLVLNLVALGFGWISQLIFWVIIGVGALFAFVLLPRLE